MLQIRSKTAKILEDWTGAGKSPVSVLDKKARMQKIVIVNARKECQQVVRQNYIRDSYPKFISGNHEEIRFFEKKLAYKIRKLAY